MIGYVVIEWNQASHQPRVECPDLHATVADARACAGIKHADAIHVGRRERYTVAELVEVEDPASHMTADAALALINEWTPGSKMHEPLERRVRWAKACTHPDRHDGDRQYWDRIEQAAVVLGVRP